MRSRCNEVACPLGKETRIPPSAALVITYQLRDRFIHAVLPASGARMVVAPIQYIGSAGIEAANGSSQNTITNNVIEHTGETNTINGAISLQQSWGNTVTHNTIMYTPHFGIQEVNGNPSMPAGGNTFSYNDVEHTSQEAIDTGAIYVYSGSDRGATGDTIQFNKIIDTGGLTTDANGFVAGDANGTHQSQGIYLDDGVSNTLINGNFIEQATHGVQDHGGTDVLPANSSRNGSSPIARGGIGR